MHIWRLCIILSIHFTTTIQILNNLNQNKVRDSVKNVFTIRDTFWNFLKNIRRTRKWIIQLKKMVCYQGSARNWWGIWKSRGTSATVNKTGGTFKILSFWEEWRRHSRTTVQTPEELISNCSGIWLICQDLRDTSLEGKEAQEELLDLQTTTSSKEKVVYSYVWKVKQGWQRASMADKRTPQLAQMQNKVFI